MALDVDGFSILKAIAATPDAFPDVQADAAKAGRTLVAKQLKAKGLGVQGLRRLRDLLGADTFALIIDGIAAAEAKSLIGRLDKHHPDAKSGPADAHRRRVVELAGGAEPALRQAPVKASKKAPAEKKPKVTRALSSTAFAASWDGRDHDAPAGGKKKKT